MNSPNPNPISDHPVGCTLCGVEDFRIITTVLPCKHFYARQREAHSSQVHTVGESSGMLGLLTETSGGRVHTTLLPTFFCIVTSELLVPTDRRTRKAWTFRMKRAND